MLGGIFSAGLSFHLSYLQGKTNPALVNEAGFCGKMNTENRIIFLDIDGVLNCQLFYQDRASKKLMRKAVKKGNISGEDYHASQLCKERISWLNGLCERTGAQVVISSTWRSSGLEYCKKALSDNGATFDIIDVTPWLKHEGCVRGNEIYHWIEKNSVALFGIPSHEYRSYVIIDDDSDMLLWQAAHFFQTDNYSGLTPNTVYKIERFFTGKAFQNVLNSTQ